jgi:glycosyltransferase involved in cell wall biosynthesis
LSYIINGLDKNKYTPIILTLSPEPSDDSMKDYFLDSIDVDVKTLNLSRLKGAFYAKYALNKFIQVNGVDLIHSQGIRADSLLSKLSLSIPWVMTSRNYPYDDYPMKFGKVKGTIMAHSHIRAMNKCSNVIACSKTIASELSLHNINAIPIQNGVDLAGKLNKVSINCESLDRPVFITVGSLIPRKNVAFIINAFNEFTLNNKGSLFVLGDGPDMDNLKDISNKSNTYFEGNVDNVTGYLELSDYFISASLSEGLPNTVLEGLASGLPSLLSDISSHKEIATECPQSCHVFNLLDGSVGLSKKLENISDIFSAEAASEAKNIANSTFSARAMSLNYQTLYESLAQ